MTAAARERLRVRTPVLCLSAAAWMALVLNTGGRAMAAHCAAGESVASRAGGWALMLAAMMAPAVVAPVRHVRASSFARRRARAVALFVAGYTAVWMAAGSALMAASWVGPVLGIAMTLVWQCSPAKQRCMNRGHAHRELRAFGRAADADALRFGLAHGAWCVGSCWALMLLPLVLPGVHWAAMAAVSAWVWAERLEVPAAPGWRWRGAGKAGRIVWAWLKRASGSLSPRPAGDGWNCSTPSSVTNK